MSNAKEFWDNAAKDPDVRYKYISDEWATTNEFLHLIEVNNDKWGKVLEIGCGIGRLIVPLADKHPEGTFYGIDISDEMMSLAPRRENIIYGIHVLPDNLDLIYSMLVFQHIPHEEKIEYIKIAYDKLANLGTFFFQFVVGDENAPYSYQTTDEEIYKQLSLAGFRFIEFTRSMHHQWLFVRAVK